MCRFSAALFAAAVCYATIFSAIRGIVHDAGHRPLEHATVTVRAAHSDFSKNAETNSDGEFEFSAIPAGDYILTVSSRDFSSIEQPVTVVSGSAPILHFQMKVAALRQTVEVSERAEAVGAESSTTSTMIDRGEIERTPGADRTNSLAMITDYVPGAYVVHDQLHVRGGHQVTWEVDGVPVPNTNIASNVGPQFDPRDIDYMEAQRGGYSAEFGDRAYGVFNVIPRTGFERNNEAEIVASGGSFYQTNDQLSFGSHTERFAYYASLNGNRSDFGLDTPGPAVIHDRASGFGGFGTLIFNLDQSNQLRLASSLRGDAYQIPNDPDQQAAGIRDVERENDAFVNFSWVHTGAHGLLLTVAPFFHHNRANYEGGAGDSPVIPREDRSSNYAGAQVTVAKIWAKHNARAGLYGFGQTDDTLFGLTGAGGPSIRQQENIGGNLEAAFLEDQYKPLSWLTLNGGVRLTHFSGSISENAASPRAGAAIRIPRLNWIVRGFYGRFYQAPPLSTVSGPLLAYALDEGFGFLPLRGERDEEREFGLTIPWRGWTLDADNFHTRAVNFFDHNVIGNSNIFFPLTIDGARIRGWEVTLRSPRLLKRGQVHLAYSFQHALGLGAINGGLTDFSPPEGVFFLDHDQRHTLNAGGDINLPHRSWAAGNAYYGSGFVDGEGPEHLPGRTTVDLSLGKSFRESWSVSLNALNVANRRFLLDNSLTFGGTHYAEPRHFFAQVRYRFRY